MLKRFNTALMAIALGATALVAACTQQPEQKSDQSQPAATSEQPATSPQRTAEQSRPAATPTAAPTPVQIAQCVRDGLTADSRTQAQARTLQVNAEVTINGAKQRLAAGQSYWSLCSGPSVEARLASITTERNQWRAYAERLEPLAMVNPQQGLNARGNTWFDEYSRVNNLNNAMTADLAKAQRDARVNGVLLFLAIAALFIMGAIWFFTSRSKRPGTAHQATHDLTGVDPRGSAATTSGVAAD